MNKGTEVATASWNESFKLRREARESFRPADGERQGLLRRPILSPKLKGPPGSLMTAITQRGHHCTDTFSLCRSAVFVHKLAGTFLKASGAV